MNALLCPACRNDLAELNDEFNCPRCKRIFKIGGGIPLLFLPDEVDITETVKRFYEENPFPNYEEIDSAETLRQKARAGFFAKLLDEQIPPAARILEAGCGTGQMANFLALSPAREVWGTDMSLNSLKLAQKFKRENGIGGVRFVQMNLFHPAFREESFDYVISTGVLHHTQNPKLGFKTILQLLKPGGYIIVGLYNKYGRIWTDLRRIFFKLFRRRKFASAKQQVWFTDQYRHPHESKHTFGEVLGWFKEFNVEFIGGIPKTEAFSEFHDDEDLFNPVSKGTALDHFLVQLRMLLVPKEGGLFIMIGRKKA